MDQSFEINSFKLTQFQYVLVLLLLPSNITYVEHFFFWIDQVGIYYERFLSFPQKLFTFKDLNIFLIKFKHAFVNGKLLFQLSGEFYLFTSSPLIETNKLFTIIENCIMIIKF